MDASLRALHNTQSIDPDELIKEEHVFACNILYLKIPGLAIAM
jgi:hypothetical protein